MRVQVEPDVIDWNNVEVQFECLDEFDGSGLENYEVVVIEFKGKTYIDDSLCMFVQCMLNEEGEK